MKEVREFLCGRWGRRGLPVRRSHTSHDGKRPLRGQRPFRPRRNKRPRRWRRPPTPCFALRVFSPFLQSLPKQKAPRMRWRAMRWGRSDSCAKSATCAERMLRTFPTLSLREGLFVKLLPCQKTKSPPRKAVDFLFWQGQKDSNPRHPVLETSVLPTELYPYTTEVLYHKCRDFATPFCKKIKKVRFCRRSGNQKGRSSLQRSFLFFNSFPCAPVSGR